MKNEANMCQNITEIAEVNKHKEKVICSAFLQECLKNLLFVNE